MRHVCAIATVAATTLLCGCSSSGGSSATTTTATASTAAAPSVAAPFQGEPARAAGAVADLARALRDGDVARLCRQGAVFTAEVVAAMNVAPQSCEQLVELSDVVARPPTLSAATMSFRPDLAVVDVRVGSGATIPLSVVRDGQRWLVSFSDGNEPLAALAAA